MATLDAGDEGGMTIEDLAKSDESFLIEARPEYGATAVCLSLRLAILRSGKRALSRNARHIPNYRKKLETEFGSDIGAAEKPTLILDDFDAERDDRLLRELSDSKWFSRVILVAVNRRLSDGFTPDTSSLPFQPRLMYLWALGRTEIRNFASIVLDPNDFISESRAVDKVYSDLLSLRIPLTPSNVVMYLRVLQREGDFEPLSRVDILSRYLSELLRKPSDAMSDSFNFKNKMDVISSFCFHLHELEDADFDERIWLNFCSEYQSKTLSEFDARKFLNEMIEARIITSHSGLFYFRYQFYYSFFLGRFLWPRPAEIKKFLDSNFHLSCSNVIDVITGLSSENTEIVKILTDSLVGHLDEFASKYVRADFDPLAKAIWPNRDDEDEKLWQPVQAAIAAGPANAKEVDELKTSMLAEARTSYQEVTFQRFTELENALFAQSSMLGDALKNADDIDGQLKIAAWRAVAQVALVVFQVGTMFAPALSKRKRFRWGGIEFVDFHKAADGHDENSKDAIVSVIRSLVDSIATQRAQDFGTAKLSRLFREFSRQSECSGFLEVLTFTCIATARGGDWFDASKHIIERTDKNAYYLSEMLEKLLYLLEYEVMSGHDRDNMKRLVALIQAKRNLGKQHPGEKAVSKILGKLESSDYFPSPAAENDVDPDRQ